MYFATNFYTASAWEKWSAAQKAQSIPDLKDTRVASTEYSSSSNLDEKLKRRRAWLKSITFAPVTHFSALLERIAFLQLMNKRHVLYFRARSKDYWAGTAYEHLDLPSLLRPETLNAPLDIATFEQRWSDLLEQSQSWRALLARCHPRLRTLNHYPETVWAIQQHYKDLLPKASDSGPERRGQSPLTDVTQSPRIAAAFAVTDLQPGRRAFVSVLALPQTVGSITFNADEQLMLMRLTALCPPGALRPHLQEGYLVGRFPLIFEDMRSSVRTASLLELEDFYSLHRRTIALIPIDVGPDFWGEHGPLSVDAISTCPWFSSIPRPAWREGKLVVSV